MDYSVVKDIKHIYSTRVLIDQQNILILIYTVLVTVLFVYVLNISKLPHWILFLIPIKLVASILLEAYT